MAGTTAATSREFECPVCKEDFTEPKMLPCTHLVCRKCLLNLLTSATEDHGGCPQCKVPVLSISPGQPGQDDLDTLVDALPTDLSAVTLLESHKILQGSHVCKVCENNVVASSFCFQCDAKLCKSCVKGHSKLPTLKNHVIEDLSQLTAQRLAANFLSRCKAHDDRPAEVFCSAHFQLICMLCATTNHRGCTDVKVIPDMAREKRAEMKHEAERLREKEKALSLQIREVKDRFKVLRKKVKDTFDDLQQCVKRRRLEVNDLIQAEEDSVLSSLAQLDKNRVAVKSNASTLEHLVASAPDVALLDMLEKLSGRLSELDRQTATTDKGLTTVVDVVFESQKLAHLKSVVASIGRITSKTRGRATQSAKSTA